MRGDTTTTAALPAHAGRAGRLVGLDALRGLAIVLMVPANAAGSLLVAPHPAWLRLLGSFAAPIFVTLAGLMVALGVDRSRSRRPEVRRGFAHALRRGGFVVLAGIFVDVVIGGYLPLLTCDVLYLIGLSLPVSYAAARGDRRLRLAWPLLIFAATPLAQATLGYRTAIDTPRLDASWPPAAWSAVGPDVARRYVVDGWFPLFPWLGFALLGVALAGAVEGAPRQRRIGAAGGIGAVVVGGCAWWSHPGAMAVRCGYSELFYPATLGFVATAAGAVSLLVVLLASRGGGRLSRRLAPLGRRSLLLYVVHLLAIDRLGAVVGDELALGPFVVLCLDLILGLLLLTSALDVLAGSGPRRRVTRPAVT
jgi:uncharacterized protein